MDRKLHRLTKERLLGGVCAGLAEYLGVDVVLVRLAWVQLAVLGGPGLLTYAVAWVVVPAAPAGGVPPAAERADRSAVVFGYALIAIGAYYGLRLAFPHGFWVFRSTVGRLWPLLLVGAGLLLVAGRSGRRGVRP